MRCKSPAVDSAFEISKPPVLLPSPMVSEAAEMPASSALLKLSAFAVLLPRSIARQATSGLIVTAAFPAVPPKSRPPLKLMLSACSSTVWLSAPEP